MDDVKLA